MRSFYVPLSMGQEPAPAPGHLGEGAEVAEDWLLNFRAEGNGCAAINTAAAA
jgi:hypothetical protein